MLLYPQDAHVDWKKKKKNHWIFDHFLEPWPHIGGMENFLSQSLSSNQLHGAPVMSIHGIQQKF